MPDVPARYRAAATAALMALLLALSLVPDHGVTAGTQFVWLVSSVPDAVQNAMHVIAYGVLSAMLAWSLVSWQRPSRRYALAGGVSVAFGVLMEVLQSQVPGRYGTLADILLNAIGAALGLLAAGLLRAGTRGAGLEARR